MTRIGAVFASFLLCALVAPAVYGQSITAEKPLPPIDPATDLRLSGKSLINAIDTDLVGPYEIPALTRQKSIHTG